MRCVHRTRKSPQKYQTEKLYAEIAHTLRPIVPAHVHVAEHRQFIHVHATVDITHPVAEPPIVHVMHVRQTAPAPVPPVLHAMSDIIKMALFVRDVHRRTVWTGQPRAVQHP